jgi:hypothetical protein
LEAGGEFSTIDVALIPMELSRDPTNLPFFHLYLVFSGKVAVLLLELSGHEFINIPLKMLLYKGILISEFIIKILRVFGSIKFFLI